MPADPRRRQTTHAEDVRIVRSPVRKPITDPEAWRTWVILLERSDGEAMTISAGDGRDGDRWSS
jgi:hypothetical protein